MNDKQPIEVLADEAIAVDLYGQLTVRVGEHVYTLSVARDRFAPGLRIQGELVGKSACMGLHITPVARNSIEIVGIKS